MEVEQDQIGTELHVESHRFTRVARALDAAEAGSLQQPAQEIAVDRLVVDDQDSRVLEEPDTHRFAPTSDVTFDIDPSTFGVQAPAQTSAFASAGAARPIASAAGESGESGSGDAV